MNRWMILVAGLAAAVLLAGGAAADRVSKEDSDDSRSALDLASAEHGHHLTESKQKLVEHRLSTYEAWDAALLLSAEAYDLSIHIDTDGEHDDPIRTLGFCGEGFERIVEVRASDDGTLYAQIRTPHGKIKGFARLTRPDDQSVELAFPRSDLGRHVTRYEWCAQSAYYEEDNPSEECGKSDGTSTLCTDRVPDKKTVIHKL